MVKKGFFFYLLVSIVAALPTRGLAGQQTDWGKLVIDGGDSQVYQVSYDGTPVWDAMDAEQIDARRQARNAPAAVLEAHRTADHQRVVGRVPPVVDEFHTRPDHRLVSLRVAQVA